MPELSEIKIMADFVNYAQREEGFFNYMKKSQETKIKTEDDPFKGGVFTISAQSRGKELLLTLKQVGGSMTDEIQKKLLCNMGMSGNWVYMRKTSPQLEKAMKHAHLRFRSTRGNWLLLFDMRRFAKWRWTAGWSANRSPCPLTEYDLFRENLLNHFWEHKDFNKPLCEVLMNQKWFNGIGNYVRAEVLYRLDVNPFQPANQLTVGELNQLTTIIHLAFRDTYQMGGGQLKDWHNPTGASAKDFNEWIKCYSKKSSASVKDSTGRKFWFDPKWKESADLQYSKIKNK